MIALSEVELYTPHEVIPDAALLIDGARISSLGPQGRLTIPDGARRIPLAGKKAFAGFIDLHTHGLLGMDAMGADLAGVIRSLPRFGVTSFLATTVTLPVEEIEDRLQAMAGVLANPPAGANCLGIHLEGPHLSTRRPGMAAPEWFRPLDRMEYNALQEAASGQIKMITFAPEEGDAISLIPYLIDQQVIPVIGHSDASYELVAEAVAQGLAHATHTFNAMSPFHHRAPGVAGAVMAFPQIVGQLIADGHHVHPGAIRALLNAKGVDGVCLISDSSPLAALPDGEYSWAAYTVMVRDGTCRLPDGTLAGAHALMDAGFRNLIEMADLTAAQASVCASAVPARALGLGRQKGQLLPGYDADIVVMDDSYQPCLTIVGGKIAWSRDADESTSPST